MNRNYIDMHLVVDRYLRGTLSEEETAEFEERIVWDQDLMDEIELAESLRGALQRALSKDEQSIAQARRNPVAVLKNIFAVPMYAAAASFLLAVGLTSTTIISQMGQSTSPGSAQFGTTEIVPLFVTRSDNVATLAISRDAWTVILVDAPPTYAEFRATIHAGAEDTVWSQSEMQTTYPESLAIGMPGKLLPDGNYVLVLEGRNGNAGYERFQEIRFRTVTAQ